MRPATSHKVRHLKYLLTSNGTMLLCLLTFLHDPLPCLPRTSRGAKVLCPVTMSPCRLLLKTSPLVRPASLPSVKQAVNQNAHATPLECALTGHPQLIENTATLSPSECAVTQIRAVSPLECAVPRKVGG